MNPAPRARREDADSRDEHRGGSHQRHQEDRRRRRQQPARAHLRRRGAQSDAQQKADGLTPGEVLGGAESGGARPPGRGGDQRQPDAAQPQGGDNQHQGGQGAAEHSEAQGDAGPRLEEIAQERVRRRWRPTSRRWSASDA